MSHGSTIEHNSFLPNLVCCIHGKGEHKRLSVLKIGLRLLLPFQNKRRGETISLLLFHSLCATGIGF